MSSTNPSKPGPRPTSCHTCRQRRKKCDLARPHCERCLKGGFECLGYEGREPRASACRRGISTSVPPQPQPRLRSILPAIPVQQACPEVPDLATTGVLEDRQSSNPIDRSNDPAPLILGTGLHYNGARPPPTPNNGRAKLENHDHTRLQSRYQLTVHQRSSPYRPGATKSLGATFDAQSAENDLIGFLEALCQSIPPTVVSTQTIGEARFVHIINEYNLQRVSYWFMIPPVSIRGPMIHRLRASRVMWTICLATKLFQALGHDPSSAATRKYVGWIDKFETEFTIGSNNTSSLNDASDCLLAQLELTYLRFVAVNAISGYKMLQKLLPKFLHLVAVDPDLAAEHPNGNLVVSFPQAFGAPQPELKRFIMYDTAASLVLGIPPLVEYGYDGECDPVSHGFQWVHSVPVTLVEIISQVNSWRAGSRVAPLDDWRTMERRVLSWEPQPVVAESEPTVNVARLAVEEGWRHVALIYIYMGVCGVSSHDFRVQTSIRQIVRLGETVENTLIGLHMFIHYVVAGLGARSENHRSFIREKLLSFKGARVWLFRGPELSRVLDHLWDGVGSGGAPVTWNDYVRSRCTIIPI